MTRHFATRAVTTAVVAALSTTVGLAAPSQAVDRDWHTLLRSHGAKAQGCVESIPGSATSGYVILLRANNRTSGQGHRFVFSRLVGGPTGEWLPLWRTTTRAGETSKARRIKIAADDWIGVGMADLDNPGGGFGENSDPGRLGRC